MVIPNFSFQKNLPLELNEGTILPSFAYKFKKDCRMFGRKRASGFSSASTTEKVTNGIDRSGLTVIITGAPRGIGLETARVLALRGVHVVMTIRNVAAGKEAATRIAKGIPTAKIDAMELYLSSVESVRKFASEYTSSGLPLNILINNAGIVMSPFQMCKDGIESQFTTNYLGHFLLTYLLLDTMKKATCEMKREGRIVNVSAVFHNLAYEEGIRFDRLNDQEGFNRFGAYGQSKLAIILHTSELAIRFKEEDVDITANSLHPGIVPSGLLHKAGFLEGFVRTIGMGLKTPGQAASTACDLALRPQVKGISGEYFADNNLAKPIAKAADRELARKLWEFSLNLINK